MSRLFREESDVREPIKLKAIYELLETVTDPCDDVGNIDHYVILGALVGAISWNIITWYFGLPSSSSHAWIGGLVGVGTEALGRAPAASSGPGS